MQGHRLPDSEFFERQGAGTLKPGDYGRENITKTRDGAECVEWDWFVVCPNGARSVLWVTEDDSNGNRHVITEHEDGTISVDGSILGRHVPSTNIGGVGPITAEGWHGWLERGVWRE